MKNFRTNWFEVAGKANFEKYLSEFKGKEVNFLEIGCFEGNATCWMLENILTNSLAKITVIDTFEGSNEHKDTGFNVSNLYETFIENIKENWNKVTILKGKSQEELRNLILKNSFDFIYIDGSHESCDVLEDAILSFRLLKKDGIMIFDDYGWGGYPEPHRNPKLGIDSFLNCFVGQYELLLKSYQVVIKKI